jgi:hypothetical protein
MRVFYFDTSALVKRYVVELRLTNIAHVSGLIADNPIDHA